MDGNRGDRGIIGLLGELSEGFGVSGFEGEVRERLKKELEPLVDEISTDPLGNLHAVVNPEADFTLLLDAHMDEVGFVVSKVEEDGFLRISPIGSWDPILLPGRQAAVKSAEGIMHLGVIGSIPPHVQDKDQRTTPLRWEDLFLDIGASNAGEVSDLKVRVGSPGLVHQPFVSIGQDYFAGKALDNRAGCAVLVRVLELLNASPVDFRVIALFSCAEEVGARGARVAVERWRPHMAVVIEGTMATDTPGVKPEKKGVFCGKGPVVTAMDKTIIVPETLVEATLGLARRLGIPYQIKPPLLGATNAGAIQSVGSGVITGVIAVPCRYIHSPAAAVKLSDILWTVDLVENFVREAPRIYQGVR